MHAALLAECVTVCEMRVCVCVSVGCTTWYIISAAQVCYYFRVCITANQCEIFAVMLSARVVAEKSVNYIL